MYTATFISRVSDTCPLSSLIAIGGVRTIIKTRQTLRRIIFVPLKPSFTRSFLRATQTVRLSESADNLMSQRFGE